MRGKNTINILDFRTVSSLFLFLSLFTFLFQPAISVFAEVGISEDEENKIIGEQYSVSGVDQLNNKMREFIDIDEETRKLYPDFNLQYIVKSIAKGEMQFDFGAIFKGISIIFAKEVYVNIKIMLKLIILIILCGLLTNLQGTFGEKGVSEIAFFGCYVFLCGVLVKSFSLIIDLGRDVIDNMVMFMHSMIPVLTSLLLSTGNISSAAIFQPTILFIVQTIGSTVKYFSIPIIFFSLALSIANNVSDKFKVNKMSEFLKQINKWVLGILLTIFVGVITIQGFTSSVLDGISTKTAKYAVGNMVPVFGGLLSDAVDTVIGCSLILKNAVGIAGLIAIIVLVAVPMLKIMALIAVYRFTTALVEPISDKRIVNCIGECANTLSIVFVLVAIVAVMFIISITIMISAANISAMFR